MPHLSTGGFATITHPGNAPIGLPTGSFSNPTAYVGRVDYVYRMSTTEVTNAQWVMFLNAYRFTVWFDCRETLIGIFDMNEDTVLDYEDLVAWLLANADINFDGDINAIDFEDLLEAVEYFDGL